MEVVKRNKKPMRIFTPHRVMLMIALTLSFGLYFFVPIGYALIPFYLHCILYSISYYRYTIWKGRRDEAWKHYLKAYGQKGKIPLKTRIQHLRMIHQRKVKQNGDNSNS